jgi:hypothetical protein
VSYFVVGGCTGVDGLDMIMCCGNESFIIPIIIILIMMVIISPLVDRVGRYAFLMSASFTKFSVLKHSESVHSMLSRTPAGPDLPSSGSFGMAPRKALVPRVGLPRPQCMSTAGECASLFSLRMSGDVRILLWHTEYLCR